MPRGDNPNSRANLEKHKLQKGLPTEAQRKVQAKGSKRGNEVKKQYATLTEALKDHCTSDVLDQLTDMLVKRAKQGNLKAYELLRDQLGEKPTEKIEQTTKEVVIDFGNLPEGDV